MLRKAFWAGGLESINTCMHMQPSYAVTCISHFQIGKSSTRSALSLLGLHIIVPSTFRVYSFGGRAEPQSTPKVKRQEMEALVREQLAKGRSWTKGSE